MVLNTYSEVDKIYFASALITRFMRAQLIASSVRQLPLCGFRRSLSAGFLKIKIVWCDIREALDTRKDY